MNTNFDRNSEAADNAAFWIAREMSGSMTLKERAEMAAWADAAPERRRSLEELRRMLSSIDDGGTAVLEKEFERELGSIALESGGIGYERVYKIAASIMAAALLGVFATSAIPTFDRPAPIVVAGYSTKIGEVDTIKLDDGSTVDLNTASKIEVRFTDEIREVELAAGGGFFDVKKNEAQPFVIKTDKATVTVTGTSFNVSSYDNGTIVQVLNGTVTVAPLHGPTATLTAGQMVAVDAAGLIGPTVDFDPAIAFGWRQGKLQFRDTPLPDAVASLNRYFDEPINLAGEGAANLQVTGDFDIYDRDTAIEALALIFNLEVEEAGSTLRLRSGGDEDRN